jgi:DNA polymerase I-like protein with 3'-5' exonuclease and polymerase domains
MALMILEPDLPNDLETVSKDFCNFPAWKHLSHEDLPLYGCKDADATTRLWQETERQLVQEGLKGIFDTSMEVLPLTLDMWWTGLKIDTKRMEEMAGECREREARAESGLNEFVRKLPSRVRDLQRVESDLDDVVAGTKAATGRERVAARKALGIKIEELRDLVCPNWNSPTQLVGLLKEMGIEVPLDKDTKQPTTGAAVLQEMVRKNPEKNAPLLGVIHLRKAEKERSTFLSQKVDDQNRIHPQIIMTRSHDEKGEQEGACSGRLASKNPNIQNWPGPLRVIVVPDHEGWEMMEADYKQIEWREICWKVGGRLWDLVNDPSFDVHKLIASRVYKKDISEVTKAERYLGKRCVYAAAYKVGPLTLSQSLAKEEIFLSMGEVKTFLNVFYETFPEVLKTQRAWFQEAQATGKLTNPFGRYRRFLRPEREETKITNFWPQSTAGDIILRAMARLRYSLPKPARIAIQVHDSLTFMYPRELRGEVAKCVIRDMTVENPEMRGFKPDVDIKVGGKSWGELEALV